MAKKDKDGKPRKSKEKKVKDKKVKGKRAKGKKDKGKKDNGMKGKDQPDLHLPAVEEPAPHEVDPATVQPGGKADGRRGPVDPDRIAQSLQVGPDFVLDRVDPGSTPGIADSKAAAAATEAIADELADLQERLYANGKDGGSRSLLLIVQGMDTSGKGGIMRHVVGAMDPQGVQLTAFKAPTAEERSKGYLWRIRRALPTPGYIGVFDRSQYEDVLIARVRSLVPRAVWARRYAGINTFETQQVNRGTTIVKVMLHISKEEQGRRLAERIERPDKHWKYNPGDIDERMLWEDYQAAYQDALVKCSTPSAPWYVVPADHKWYARAAVAQLVLGALRGMDLGWPAAHFDPAVELERLEQS